MHSAILHALRPFHGSTLMLPLGLSDVGARIATVSVDDLLTALTSR